ncbi:Sodium/glucose cotransporter [Posidoniimonas polymericola]|uniref:Sodium/glucose cotransporter n=1 Tax=Posidoniimonas polymericola TaxID=2528002 RepID=A0A5C5YRN1_9BACT|nr:sodium:solute symporter [Posidoniimonas polymericola]TWT77549.1 Sodium/glucose cotransporter [Posidoniimonas polymericola]
MHIFNCLPLAAMGALDWGVIIIYFCIIGFVAWWYGRNQQDTDDFFLAGRNAGWVVIGASIFTSNIGSEHIVGLAGQGAATGMAMAHWELHAWVLILLAGIFVPFYYKSGVQTIPEFLEKRFNATTRLLLSLVSLVAYIFTKVSVTVYAGAIVFKALLPEIELDLGFVFLDAFWIGAFSTVILTGLYTVFGGMRAIMATATPQAVIILFGSFVITAIGLNRLSMGEGVVAGWGELVGAAKENADQFALWRPLSDPDFPWLGVLIASPIIGIWYWCTDQYIVQRTLAAKDLATARRGALFGGLLKVWPVLIFLIPGMIGWTLDKEFNRGADNPALAATYAPDASKEELAKSVADANVALRDVNLGEDENGARGFYIPRKLQKNADGQLAFAIDGDQVFPSLVSQLLPPGIRGLIVACLLSALMSSLASLFNSSAALFTVDVYEKIRPGMSQSHLLTVGRIATTVVVGAGIVWIPVMKAIAGGGLYQYLQSVQGYLAPPITAVFLLGLFWPRMNAAGATAALAIGFVLGMFKLTVQAMYGVEEGKISDPAWLASIGDFNFLYATGVLMLISIVVMIGVSLMTAAPTEEKTRGLTYGSIHHLAEDEISGSWDWGNKLLAGLILLCVGGMYVYFSFWLR